MTSLHEALQRVLGAKHALQQLLNIDEHQAFLPDSVRKVISRGAFWDEAKQLRQILDACATATMAVQVGSDLTIIGAKSRIAADTLKTFGNGLAMHFAEEKRHTW